MDNAIYTTLGRQSGLLREMQVIANNIANVSTTGYRREAVVFAEHVSSLEDGGPSLSMANGTGRATDDRQGPLSRTNATFDFAIEGEGFFLLLTPEGERLSRAGSFGPTAEGELAAPDGARLLDLGGAPIFVPPDARTITLAPDGTLAADGQPIAQVGVFRPVDPLAISREHGTRFESREGWEPIEEPKLLQGFVEGSNVAAVTEMARMIEVQRSYELGQSFLDSEDERIRAFLRSFGR